MLVLHTVQYNKYVNGLFDLIFSQLWASQGKAEDDDNNNKNINFCNNIISA